MRKDEGRKAEGGASRNGQEDRRRLQDFNPVRCAVTAPACCGANGNRSAYRGRLPSPCGYGNRGGGRGVRPRSHAVPPARKGGGIRGGAYSLCPSFSPAPSSTGAPVTEAWLSRLRPAMASRSMRLASSNKSCERTRARLHLISSLNASR